MFEEFFQLSAFAKSLLFPEIPNSKKFHYLRIHNFLIVIFSPASSTSVRHWLGSNHLNCTTVATTHQKALVPTSSPPVKKVNKNGAICIIKSWNGMQSRSERSESYFSLANSLITNGWSRDSRPQPSQNRRSTTWYP